MTSARQETVIEGEEGCYHCIARCVRRAFLYGYDKVTGKNYNHRKEWARERLKFLVKVFCIEVLACGLMDNHQHSLLRTRPDLLEKLSDDEVIRRWLRLYPLPGGKAPTDEDLVAIRSVPNQMKKLRSRLLSVSWFMKSLNEYMARRSNKEDGCKGRFWEGRFKCQRIAGEAALLGCAVYIDLNPIRAGIAETPEESTYTSVYERIHGLKTLSDKSKEPDLWFCPIRDSKERRGFLSITLQEYLDVVDATGRILKAGKRGSIPDHLSPILTRLGIDPSHWVNTTSSIGKGFSTLVGCSDSMLVHAAKRGKKWLKGLSLSRLAFA